MNNTGNLIDCHDITQSNKKHVWHHLTQHKPYEENEPMVMVSAEGMYITNNHGAEFLDATSGGLWTVNVGYGRDSIAKVIYDQLVKMPYYAGTIGSEPGAVFAQQLIELLPGLSRVYYSNSGSEANEKAYKLVRQRAHFISGGKKHKIIYRDRDYHGTTIATLSSTGQFQRKNQYGPFVEGFVEMPHCCCYRCPFGKTYGQCNIECAHSLEDIIVREGADTVGAVVLEPITAGGGVIVPPAEYFPVIAEICKKYDVLLHIDEVVCGLGRTGKWFGHQHFGITPDIVTMAKGVASGYAAISVTATSEALFNMFKANADDPMSYFRDVSTFGGCTSGPVAAIENLKVINEENLLDNVNHVGNYLFEKLYELQDKHPCIGEVRGKGLLAGLELVLDHDTKEPVPEAKVVSVFGECFNRGLLVGRTNRSFEKFNNTLVFSPAFICSTDNVDQMVETMDIALGTIA